ncbi:hypothetical protein OAI75_03845 [Woeseiaceae bacterium]|nr:hypothetical protein [Woeseiaceae bacterium]
MNRIWPHSSGVKSVPRRRVVESRVLPFTPKTLGSSTPLALLVGCGRQSTPVPLGNRSSMGNQQSRWVMSR